MSAPIVIETHGLCKRYGDVEALRGLDLRVPAGSIYGFLGRNGAGKTTTIKALMGLIRPTAGEGRVFGYRVGEPRDGIAIRRRTAHVGEDRSAWPEMTADQVLSISRPLFPSWNFAVEQRCLETFEIPERVRVGRFSKGARTAFALTLALARAPDLLLLDEPTDGLDPAINERVLQALVRRGRGESRPDDLLLVPSPRGSQSDCRPRRRHREGQARVRGIPRRTEGQLSPNRGGLRRRSARDAVSTRPASGRPARKGACSRCSSAVTWTTWSRRRGTSRHGRSRSRPSR